MRKSILRRASAAALLLALTPLGFALAMQAPEGAYRSDWHQAPFAEPVWLVQCIGQCPDDGLALVANPGAYPPGQVRVIGGPYQLGTDLERDRGRLVAAGLPATPLRVEVFDETGRRIDGLVLADPATLAQMTATAVANQASPGRARVDLAPPSVSDGPSVSGSQAPASPQAQAAADYPRGGHPGFEEIVRRQPVPLRVDPARLNAAQRLLTDRFDIHIQPYRILAGSGGEIPIANARGADISNNVLRVGTTFRLCNRGQLYEKPFTSSRSAESWSSHPRHSLQAGELGTLALGQCMDVTPDRPGLVTMNCIIHAHETYSLLVLPADHDLTEESIQLLLLHVSQGQSGEFATFSRLAPVAAATQAGAGCSGFTGTWSTDRGLIVMQLGAGGFEGRYDFAVPGSGSGQGNRMSGLMTGERSLSLTFEQPGHPLPIWRIGRFVLELSVDGRSFEGEIWASDGTSGGTITGNCQGPPR